MTELSSGQQLLKKEDFFEDPTLPLQIYIRDPQPEFPLHSHGFDELVIILKGTALHVIDGKEFPIKVGDVFVLAPNHEHQYREMHGLALANILFDSAALGMPNWDIRALPGFHALFELEPVLRAQHQFNSHLVLNDSQLDQATALLQKLTHESSARNPGYRVMATGLFMQLAVYLSRCYTQSPTKDSINLLRIGDTIAYIETNYTENINLDDLARKAHLSPRHFSRVFKECIGHSPIEHLLHIRIRKASELLKQTNRTITDVAFECGFSDSNYFARCFRKIVNQTPSQYRRSSD